MRSTLVTVLLTLHIALYGVSEDSPPPRYEHLLYEGLLVGLSITEAGEENQQHVIAHFVDMTQMGAMPATVGSTPHASRFWTNWTLPLDEITPDNYCELTGDQLPTGIRLGMRCIIVTRFREQGGQTIVDIAASTDENFGTYTGRYIDDLRAYQHATIRTIQHMALSRNSALLRGVQGYQQERLHAIEVEDDDDAIDFYDLMIRGQREKIVADAEFWIDKASGLRQVLVKEYESADRDQRLHLDRLLDLLDQSVHQWEQWKRDAQLQLQNNSGP